MISKQLFTYYTKETFRNVSGIWWNSKPRFQCTTQKVIKRCSIDIPFSSHFILYFGRTISQNWRHLYILKTNVEFQHDAYHPLPEYSHQLSARGGGAKSEQVWTCPQFWQPGPGGPGQGAVGVGSPCTVRSHFWRAWSWGGGVPVQQGPMHHG